MLLTEDRSPAKAGAQLGDAGESALRPVTSAIPAGPRPSPGNEFPLPESDGRCC